MKSLPVTSCTLNNENNTVYKCIVKFTYYKFDQEILNRNN